MGDQIDENGAGGSRGR